MPYLREDEELGIRGGLFRQYLYSLISIANPEFLAPNNCLPCSFAAENDRRWATATRCG